MPSTQYKILPKVHVRKLSHQGEYAIGWKLTEAMETSMIQCLQYKNQHNNYIKE